MYPTKEEFKGILRTDNLHAVVEHYLFKGTPFFFANDPDLYTQMLKQIARGLHVPRKDICVVGSARIGFSLSPFRYGEPFYQGSDLDIIVVSQALFDLSWIDILTKRRINWSTLSERARKNLKSHRKKHYIYKGWIYPSGMLEVLDIGKRWLTTFNGLSQIPYLSGRTISSRLYRTWTHASYYHESSLRKIKRD